MNQFSIVELNETTADYKSWLTDAQKNGWSGDKLTEYLKRLAYLLSNNLILHHLVAEKLPQIDINNFIDELNATKAEWHRVSVPIDWPIEPDARLAKQLAILNAIGEGKITLYDLIKQTFRRFEVFLTEVFIPATRDFERQLKKIRYEIEEVEPKNGKKLKTPMTTKAHFSLDLFISHSSKDESIAKALIEFLRSALALPHDRVRCTSVDGYKLSAGVPTELELKREIHESRCFIGLLTQNSLQSSYVLFELGARWGSGARLIPVLAAGQKASELRPPLSNLNALSCAKDQEMHQLVHELARELNKKIPLPASYNNQLKALLKVVESSRKVKALVG